MDQKMPPLKETRKHDDNGAMEPGVTFYETRPTIGCRYLVARFILFNITDF